MSIFSVSDSVFMEIFFTKMIIVLFGEREKYCRDRGLGGKVVFNQSICFKHTCHAEVNIYRDLSACLYDM